LPLEDVVCLLGSTRSGKAPAKEPAPDAAPSPGAWRRMAKLMRLLRGDGLGDGLSIGVGLCEEICDCDSEGDGLERGRQRAAPKAAAAAADEGAALSSELEGMPDQTVTSRATCLILLLLLQSSSSMILEHFQLLMRTHPRIIIFLTMLVGAGGNAGCQSAVQVVRQLTLAAASSSEERPSLRRILGHEITVGLRLAMLLSLVSLVRCSLFHVPKDEVLAITLSLVTIVFASTSIGAALPIILDRVGLDAGHAGAAVQVLMDMLGVLLTCVISSLVLDIPMSGEMPVEALSTTPAPSLHAEVQKAHTGHFLRHRVVSN